jgi:hypothetical protein
MTSRPGSSDRAMPDSEGPTRISDVRPPPSPGPDMVTVARRPTGQTGKNAALSAAGAASALQTNRALPKLPRAPTPPPETQDSETGDLDIAVDELEKALAEPEAEAANTAMNTGKTEPTPRVPPNQLPAICTFGRFEILGRIAFGGMAEIFLGRESTDHRRDAHAGDQADPPARRRRCRVHRDVPRRGASRHPAQPPAHLPHLRVRRARGVLLHRDGVDLRRGVRKDHPPRPQGRGPAARVRGEGHRAGRRGAPLRAPREGLESASRSASSTATSRLTTSW